MGTILYAGPYNPTHHPGTPANEIEFYQNFTLELPSGFAQGPAVLNVAHLGLLGVSSFACARGYSRSPSLIQAGPTPFLELKNSTIYVV